MLKPARRALGYPFPTLKLEEMTDEATGVPVSFLGSGKELKGVGYYGLVGSMVYGPKSKFKWVLQRPQISIWLRKM